MDDPSWKCYKINMVAILIIIALDQGSSTTALPKHLCFDLCQLLSWSSVKEGFGEFSILPLLLSCFAQSRKARGNVGTSEKLQADGLIDTIPAKPNSTAW